MISVIFFPSDSNINKDLDLCQDMENINYLLQSYKVTPKNQNAHEYQFYALGLGGSGMCPNTPPCWMNECKERNHTI